MRLKSLFTLLILSPAAALCQSYNNPSFETPNGGGTAPSGWEVGFIGDNSNASNSYITSGGAADGVAFVRSTITTSNTIGGTDFWSPTDLFNDVPQPNTRYRLTVAFRRSHPDLRANIVYNESGGAGFGNSAIGYFFSGVFTGGGTTSDPVNTWYDVQFEFTTDPAGIYNKGWGLQLGAGYFLPPPGMPIGETIDIDNVRIEVLEELADATLTIGSGNLLYDFTNTDVQIRFLSNATTGDVTVEKASGAPSNIGTANTPGKYWTITSLLPGAFSAEPIFSYTDTELSNNGMNEGELNLIRRTNDGDGWVLVPSTLDTVGNTIRPSSPVSSFSQWAIASNGFPLDTTVPDWTAY